jgi:hypothetical protein
MNGAGGSDDRTARSARFVDGEQNLARPSTLAARELSDAHGGRGVGSPLCRGAARDRQEPEERCERGRQLQPRGCHSPDLRDEPSG